MTDAEKETLGRLLIAIAQKDFAVRVANGLAHNAPSVRELIAATTELDEAIAEARALMEAKP